MLDIIENHELEHDCPSCGKKFKFTLKNLSKGDTVKCKSCGDLIELKTDDKSKKGIRDMQKAVNDLDNTLRNFGRGFK